MIDTAASAEGPPATWTWDDEESATIPNLDWQVPNPHFQLREDLQVFNDVMLFGADIASDGATIFGHSLVLVGISGLAFPPPAGEVTAVASEMGATAFLQLANAIDAAATVDVALTEGPASPQGLTQEFFLIINVFTGRTTWYLEMPVSLLTGNFQVVGDVVDLGEKYGCDITFEEWLKMQQDANAP